MASNNFSFCRRNLTTFAPQLLNANCLYACILLKVQSANIWGKFQQKHRMPWKPRARIQAPTLFLPTGAGGKYSAARKLSRTCQTHISTLPQARLQTMTRHGAAQPTLSRKKPYMEATIRCAFIHQSFPKKKCRQLPKRQGRFRTQILQRNFYQKTYLK